MYGQTISMYKTLVDAYRTVLERMRENNLVLPMTMIMAILGGSAVSQKAAAADLYWAPSTNPAAGPWNGVWDTGTSNWNPNNPALTPVIDSGHPTYGSQTWASGSRAIFALPPAIGATSNTTPTGGAIPPAPYLVNVTENVTANSIEFAAAGYTLTGTGAVVLTGPGVILMDNSGLTPAPASVSGIDGTIGCTIAGGIGMTKDGAGTLYLTGTNNGLTATTGYKTTTVLHGALQIGLADAVTGLATSGTLGTGDVTLTNAGDSILRFARTDVFTVANNIHGAGDVYQSGSGTTVLTGANNYSGATHITRGTLQIGTGGSLGNGAGTVFNDSQLEFNNGGGLVVGNVITGAGDINNIGGTTTITNANTYTGKTTVSAGLLRFNQRLGLSGGANWNATQIHVMGGADLYLDLKSDDGTVNPNGFTAADFAVISGLAHSTNGVQDGGFRKNAILSLDTGNSVATTVGGLGNTGDNLNLRKLGTGLLTFSGAVSYTGTTTFVANGGLIDGTTIEYTSGALTGNIVRTGSADYVGNLTKSGAGTLTLSGTNSYTGITTVNAGMLQFTTRNSLYNGGFIDIPSGLTTFPADMWTADKIHVMGGATFALNVGGSGFTSDDVDVFTSPFFNTSGNFGTYGFEDGAILGLDTTNGNFTYATSIGDTSKGALGLTKLGANTLILTGDSFYSGPTLISAGTLQLGNGGNTGSLGINTGTITDNGTLAINRDTSSVVTIANTITGTGGVSQLGTGTTVLSGLSPNDYTGDTFVAQGVLQAGKDEAFGKNYVSPVAPAGNLGTNAQMIVATNGTLDLNGNSATVGALSGQGSVQFNGTGNLTVTGARDTGSEFSGVLSGNGNLTLALTAAQLADIASYTGTTDPVQTQILTGNNTYTGTTTITDGVLQVGNGGLTGTLGTGDVTNNSSPTDTNSGDPRYGLTINRGGTIDIANAIHGTGDVGIVGSGTVTLSGTSDYSGQTVVKSGRLNVTGTLASDIRVDPTVYTTTTTSGQTTTYTDSLATAVLSGYDPLTNTSGSTTGSLMMQGGSSIVGQASGKAFKAGNGMFVQTTVLWTGTQVGTGSTSWTPTFLDQVNIIDGSGLTGLHTIDVIDYGVVGGTRPTLGEFNTAALGIGTTDRAGASITDDAANHKITVVMQQATRTWNSAQAVWQVGGAVASWTGTDTLDGTGANAAKKYYDGDTVIFNDSGSGGAGTHTVTLNTVVAPGGTYVPGTYDSVSGKYQGGQYQVSFNNTTNASSYVITGAGAIGGIASVLKDGPGTTIFDVDNTYAGTTTVNGGILRIGNGGTRGMLGQGDVMLGLNGTLLFARSDTDSDFGTTATDLGGSHVILVNNKIMGAGSVTQAGVNGNSIVLNGDNTYTGTTSVRSGALLAGNSSAFGIQSDTTVNLGGFLVVNDGVHDFDITLGALNGGGFVVLNGIARGTTLTLDSRNNAGTVFSGQLNDTNRSYSYTIGQTANDWIRMTDAAGHRINYQNERTDGFGLLEDSLGISPADRDVGGELIGVINGHWVDTASATTTAPPAYLQGNLWLQRGVNWYKVMTQPATGAGWDNNGMPANLVKDGAYTQTFSGDNTYTGATTILHGTLQVGNGGSLSNRSVDGVLTDAHGTLGHTSAISITNADATLAFNRVDNALIWGADAWFNGALYAGGINDVAHREFDRPRGALVIAADISGVGTILQAGTGTTTLTGDQSNFSGKVTVAQGTLRIGDEINDTIIDMAHPETTTGNTAYKGSSGQVANHIHNGLQNYAAGAALGDGSITNVVEVDGGATLAFNLANDYTETHAITGAGNVAQTGSNQMTMQGASTYNGATTVASTVVRYGTGGAAQIAGGNVTDANVVFGQDAVIGGIMKAGTDTVLNAGGTAAVSGAFGVQSVVSVNAGATLDLAGHSNWIGALKSDTTALTDGNSRVAEYLPNGEVHAGTSTQFGLGTAGVAVMTSYRNNVFQPQDTVIAVGIVRLGGATLTVGDGNQSGDFSGVITGSGTLVKIGTGTQILSGDSWGLVANDDYAWGQIYNAQGVISTPTALGADIQIRGGTLQLGNGTVDPLGHAHGALGFGHVLVAAGATFAFDRTDTMSVDNAISGAGNVRQFGTGVTNLTGNNTYTGTTQVDAGTLRAGGDYAFGTIDTTNTTTILNTIGRAVVNGGTLDLNNKNINFGSLNGGAGGVILTGTSSSNTLTVGWFGNAADGYSGVIQGSGNFTKVGTGTQVLFGLNTYTGNTTVMTGTLKAGIATVGGTNPTAGAFGVNSALTIGGTPAGSSTATTGTVDLNGYNETIGSLAGAAGNTLTNTSGLTDATLTINGTNVAPVNYAGALSDGASRKINLVKAGAGTQTLSGQFTYTGTTAINGGKLILDYANMPALNIPQKGALSLGGAELEFDHLGNRTQAFVSTTITAGNTNKLTRDGNWTGSGATPTGVDLGILNYTSGALDVSNIGTTAGWIKISGLSGSTNAASYTNQAFLFNGIVTANNGMNLIGTDANGYFITAGTADYSQGGIIGSTALLPTPAPQPVNAGTAVRLISAGWNASNTPGGELNGVISLANSGTTDIASILNAYASGTTSNTDGSNKVLLSIGSGNTLRLNTQGSIVSTAGADLVIGDANPATAGSLTAGGVANLDGTLNAAASTNNSGSITVNAGGTSAVPITVTVNSAIVDNGTGAVGINKVGQGTLVIATGGGSAWSDTVATATGSTYSGATVVSQGSLAAGAAYALSSKSQVVLAAGATLDLNGYDNRIGSLADGTVSISGATSGGDVHLGTGGLTLGEDNTLTATFSGVIDSGSTSNGLTKVGTGTQILTGANTYVGTTSIYQGTLQLGNGGSTGSLGGGFINLGNGALAGTLAFKRSDSALVFGNSISGTGNVSQLGTGTTTLSGVNSYQGTTTVSNGTLAAGSTSAFGSNSAVSVASGATLALRDFSNSIGSLAGSGFVTLGSATLTTGADGTSTNFSGAISGTGGLTKTGTGTQTLSGANGYTGATTVSQGTLALNYLNGSNRLSAASSLVLEGGNIIFENLGANTQSFASTQVQLTAPGTPFQLSQTGWTSGVVDLGSLGNPVSGISSWVGSLDIQGLSASETWIKTSDARYASTFNWSGKATSGGQRVATDANGYFILVSTTDYSQGGAIGDPAGPSFASTDVVRLIDTGYGGNTANSPVTLFAAGTTDVGGVINEYAAGTTNPDTNTSVTLQIGNTQTLRVGSFGVSDAGAGTDLVVSGGNLTASVAAIGFNAGTHVIDVSSTIVDDGANAVGVMQNGGTTVLTGANTYTGTTTVNSGTLQVGSGAAAGSLGSGDVLVNSGGTLAFDRSDPVTLGNVLTGTGTVAQNGGSTLTINNATGFTGTVAANAGTLDFDSAASLAGATAASGATLNFNANETVTSITNAGTMTTGGILAFTTMANNGTFQVRSGGELDFGSSSIGTGTGTIQNAGTLSFAAGSSTTNAIVNSGTMTAAGAVAVGTTTFNSTSHLTIAGSNTLITSSGAITVNAGAKLDILSAAGFAVGSPVKILTGTSETGLFTIDPLSASPGTNMHWVNATDGQSIYVGVQHSLTLPAGSTIQQTAIVDALTVIGDQITVNGDIQNAINTLSGQSGSAFTGTVNSLTGHDRSAMDSIVQHHTHTLGHNLLQWAQFNLSSDETVVAGATDRAMRATALGDVESGDLSVEDEYGLQFFMRADHVTESKDQQTNGVLASSATGNIFTVGIHNQLSSDWNIGCAFTYDATDVDSGDGLGTSKDKTYGFDAYISHLFDSEQHWFVAGDVGLGWTTYDNQRRVGSLTATSSTKGVAVHVSGELGYHADLWKDARLTPYAGLSYVNNSVDAATESLPGAPGLALSYDKHTSDSMQSTLGADFAQGINLGSGYSLTPSIGAAWHHQLGSNDSSAVSTHFVGAPGAVYNTYLGTLSKDAIEIQGAVSLQVPGGFRAFVTGRHYEGMDSGNKGHQDSIGAGFQYDF